MKIDKFKGLNTRQPAEELEKGEFRQLTDLYVTNGQKLKQRPAAELLVAGDFHSLHEWSNGTVVVKDGTLYAIDDTGDLTVLDLNVTAHETMSYVEVNNKLYYSNKNENGVIINGERQDWGLDFPDIYLCQTGSGSMAAGRYMVFLTYTSANGEESPASAPYEVEAPANASLSVHFKDVPDTASTVNVYMTGPNGSEPFLVTQTSDLSSPVEVYSSMGTAPLMTLDYVKPPTSHIIRYYNGRIVGAFDNVLWYTDALAYNRTNMATNYYLFPEEITMIEPVMTGIFVGSDQTYFLSGNDCDALEQHDVDETVPITHTSLTVDAAEIPLLGENTVGKAAIWLSSAGFMLGLENGAVRRLSEDKISFPVGDTGAMQLVKQNGIIQLLGTLREPSDDTNTFEVSDRVTAKVFRNGIQI